ncbi:flagellar basal body-associated protein FliL [Providencia vermicola]|uniref:flagellar basal body-associated protein FliL n=1 Tax=Providencia TaxID=586 RepID=UPI00197CB59C|nr:MULTISPECIES: flagellar basal body-associated protein FliL [Providencia]HEC8327653.1 flagellar basal body-associated protein FliL [Providencia rettgeri]MBN4865426.1 flagellar basal body-associated protein FliL [Providencia stuartii]MBN4874349.1 flagellar basal body-associated protein FliL [Providencia stuartii]MBN4879439.1 flagellar basal body-associated protein FliL [Providencia stuartii]MBN4883550.1 flagellar basal body-associated protein FliL [Providencia stuartii]
MSSRKESKRSNKGLLILFALVALAGAGFGGYTWWTTQQDTQTASEDEKRPNMPQPIFMELEPFTVNLAGVDGPDRVLYIHVTLRLANEKSRKQLHEYLPEVRSRLLLLLSEQKAKNIENHDGKLQLMKEIKQTLTPTLIPGDTDQDISDVLFTTFILR